MRVITSAQMKQVEENSLAHDLTYMRLMENAGSAAAAFVRRTFRVEGLNCLVFCGMGNNGGDGFVAARKLFESGANVVIILVDGAPATDGAAAMLESAERLDIMVLSLPLDIPKITLFIQHADIVIDAIYGTGFHGTLSGNSKIATEMISDAIAAVISLDVPSGVECDTARPAEKCVHADFTVVFDTMKPVHVIPKGAALCGKIELLDIGIPSEAHEGIESIYLDITTEAVYNILPKRKPDSHKGDFGTLLIIGGSSAYRGAPALAALGALRSGAGIVKIASVEAVCASASARLFEPVYLSLPQNGDGGICAEKSILPLERELSKASAVLFGCGLGDSNDTLALLELVLKKAKSTIIIDADGINALSRNINILQEANVPVILTPHPGEMARLCGMEAQEVQDDRLGIAIDFVSRRGVILVLKGRETLVAMPNGSVLLNHTGNPGLAKGGSGDILAGMLGAFAAQGLEPEKAAMCAVHLHGLAADHTAARLSQYAMLPSELSGDLCDIFASLNL